MDADVMLPVDAAIVAHATFGAVALGSGAVAAWTRKGGLAHRRGGRVFAASMAAVLALALVPIVARANLMLLFIGLFSGYLVARGWRAFRVARRGAYDAVDRTLAMGAFLAGLMMLGLGAWSSALDGGFSGYGGVSLGFGVLAILLGLGDLRRLQEAPDRAEAMRTHIASMGGAYIAATTAFAVVNLAGAGLPPALVWLAPTAIGVPLIRRAVARHAPRASAAPAS